jgi:hypothetical protein
MANVGKATRAKYADLMRPHLEGVLDRVQGANVAGGVRPQYLLFIRGTIPRGERLRRSPGHCRASLKRLLASEFYSSLYTALRRDPNNTVFWSDWRRFYIAGGLNQLIAELEASGVVEYREVNSILGTTSNAIGIANG